MQAKTDDEALCKEVLSSGTGSFGSIRLPRLIEYLCRRRIELTGYKEARRFRTSLDAYDRHELVLLTSGFGLPTVGRRTANYKIADDSSQFEPDRDHQLVDVMPGSAIYRPRPLNVTELTLTALGGSLRHDSSFEPPAAAIHLRGDSLFDALSIERWQQWIVLGRDIFTEVVYKGFLFPLGHRASLVKVTERTFLQSPAGYTKAYLRQRLFIRCGRPLKEYPCVGQPNGGRQFPFDKVNILTVTSPDIIDPYAGTAKIDRDPASNVTPQPSGRLDFRNLPGLVFWPRTALIEGAEVRFDLEVDSVKCECPLIFVDNVAANDREVLARLVRYYNDTDADGNPPTPETGKEITNKGVPSPDCYVGAQTAFDPAKHFRSLRMAGQTLRYCQEEQQGSASLETALLTLKASGRQLTSPPKLDKGTSDTRWEGANGDHLFDPILQGADQPPFYPAVETSRVHLRQAERFVGRQLGALRVQFDGYYVANPLPKRDGTGKVDPYNPAEAYLSIIDAVPLAMQDKGDQSGGVFRPDGSLTAVSRHRGAMSGPDEMRIPIPGRLRNFASQFGGYNRPSPEQLTHVPKDLPAPGPANDKKKAEVFATYFSGNTKLLGLVQISDLIKLLGDQIGDPDSGLPKLVETISYGAGELQEGAADFVQTIRDKVLVPLQTLVVDLREHWGELQTFLTKRQEALSAATKVPAVTLAQIFPEVDTGLLELEVVIAKAIAETDPIAFSLSLGEIYEGGRRFANALSRAADDPVARFETAVRSRINQGVDNLAKQGEAIKEQIYGWRDAFAGDAIVRLAKWIVPGEDADAPAGDALPLPYPDFAAIGAALPAPPAGDDATKVAMELAKAKLTEAATQIQPSVGAVREVVTELLGTIDLGENSPEVLGRQLGVALLELARQRLEDDAIKVILDDIPRLPPSINEARDKALTHIALYGLLIDPPDARELEAAGEAAAAESLRLAGMFVLAFEDQINFILGVKREYEALKLAVENKRVEDAARAAVNLIELFTGPTELADVTQLCDQLKNQLNVLIGTVGEQIKNAQLCTAPKLAEPKACAIPIPEERDPATWQDQLLKPQPDEISLCMDAWLLTGSLVAAGLDVNKAQEDLEDVKDDIADEVLQRFISIQKGVAVLATLLRDIAHNTSLMHCEILADASRLQALGTVEPVGGDVCSVIPQQIKVTARWLQQAVDGRADLLRHLGTGAGRSIDALDTALNNQDFVNVVGAGTLAAVLLNLPLPNEQTLKDKVKGASAALAKAEADVAKALATSMEQLTGLLFQMTERMALWADGAAKSLQAFVEQVPLQPLTATIAELRGGVTLLSERNRQLGAWRDELARIRLGVSAISPNLSLSALLKQKVEGVTFVELLSAPKPNKQALLDALRQDLDKFEGRVIQTMRSLAAAARSAAEGPVYDELDRLAKIVLGTGAAGGVSVKKAYEDILKLRNELHNNLGASPLIDRARKALLVAIVAGRPFADGITSNDPLTIENDQLARDTNSLAMITAPISSGAQRKFLKAFFSEWGDGQSAPLRIGRQIGELIVDVLRGDLLQLIDLGAMRQDVERYIKDLVPVSAKLNYAFGTRLSSRVKDATKGIFAPDDSCRLDIKVEVNVNLLNVSGSGNAVRFEAIGELGRFDIALVGKIYEALTLKFHGASFRMASGAKPKFDIRYADYVIGPELDFIQDLQSFLSPKEGSGFYLSFLKAQPGIEAGYSLNLGTISIGTISFFNVSMNAAAILPFGDGAARFKASLSRRDSPFTISAAPYGGSGFFGIEADAKGIVGFEASFEYGGAGAFAYGPLVGQGRLMAGIYVRRMKIGGSSITEISGTFYAGGSASIWIFNFASSLYVRLGMVNGNMTGEAVFTFSFSVGLADFDYSVRVERKENKGFNGSASLEGLTRFASRNPPTLVASLDTSGTWMAGPGGVGQAMIENDTDCQGENWSRFISYFDLTSPVLADLELDE